MKHLFLLFFTGAVMLSCKENVKLSSSSSEIDSVSYAIGLFEGHTIKGHLESVKLDNIEIEMLITGIRHALSKDTTEAKLKNEQISQVINGFLTKKMEKMKADNLKAGESFLDKNAKNADVKTTESGLQYKIIKEGEGRMPEGNDTVKVHYKGTLINGTTFDSSYDRNDPIKFPLNGVIKGWTEGLQLMKEGGHYIFYIPSDLAYGENPPTPAIEPNSTLIFEVELLEVYPSKK